VEDTTLTTPVGEDTTSTDMENKCASCGGKLNEDGTECVECGTKVEEEDMPTETPGDTEEIETEEGEGDVTEDEDEDDMTF